MKIRLNEETMPVLDLAPEDGSVADYLLDVPEEVALQWRRVSTEFRNMQEKMKIAILRDFHNNQPTIPGLENAGV